MILDLGSLSRGEIKVLPFSFRMEAPDVQDVTFTDSMTCEGQVTDIGGYKKLSCHVSVPYVGACARCLDDVRGVFEFDFNRIVADRQSLSEEQLEEEGLDYLIPDSGKIDPEEDIRDEMLMIFPMRLLCSEDCPGLCPKCGKPIRSGLCKFSHEKEVDPRLSVLQTLLDEEGDDV